MEWLFKDGKNFQEFVKVITKLNSTNLLYDTEFVSNLLEEFWSDLQKTLFFFYFIPFVIFGILGVLFLTANLRLRSEPKEAPDEIAIWIYGILTSLLSFL